MYTVVDYNQPEQNTVPGCWETKMSSECVITDKARAILEIGMAWEGEHLVSEMLSSTMPGYGAPSTI